MWCMIVHKMLLGLDSPTGRRNETECPRCHRTFGIEPDSSMPGSLDVLNGLGLEIAIIRDGSCGALEGEGL